MNISFKISPKELNNLKKYLSPYKKNQKNNTFDIFNYKEATISIYHTCTLLIQGKNVYEIYEELINNNLIDTKSIKTNIEQLKLDITKNTFIDQNKINTIGCDEVGVGDFFGGLVSVACWINFKDVETLRKIGVKDSKKLSDKKMQEIFNQIIKLVKYEAKYISPKQYNDLYHQYKNSHLIKTLLHNNALSDLVSKLNDHNYKIIMDQYVHEQKYYEYLKTIDAKKSVQIDLFQTQAETNYLAVACASIIARIYFLKQISLLNKKIEKANLNITIPLGNNEKVFDVAKFIYEKNPGLLDNLIKKHFATYNKLIGEKYE